MFSCRAALLVILKLSGPIRDTLGYIDEVFDVTQHVIHGIHLLSVYSLIVNTKMIPVLYRLIDIFPLKRKTFGKFFGYSCAVVSYLWAVVFMLFIGALNHIDRRTSCDVLYMQEVDRKCNDHKYNQAYNLPHAYLTMVSGLLVSVIYSKLVRTRVNDIESSYERQNGGKPTSHRNSPNCTENVFFSYFFHLVLRALLGIGAGVLEGYKYTDPFDCFHYIDSESQVIECYRPMRIQIQTVYTWLCRISNAVSFAVFMEVLYLVYFYLCHRDKDSWNVDSEFEFKFVIEYFLNKKYIKPGESKPLFGNENNTPDSNIEDNRDLGCTSQGNSNRRNTSDVVRGQTENKNTQDSLNPDDMSSGKNDYSLFFPIRLVAVWYSFFHFCAWNDYDLSNLLMTWANMVIITFV